VRQLCGTRGFDPEALSRPAGWGTCHPAVRMSARCATQVAACCICRGYFNMSRVYCFLEPLLIRLLKFQLKSISNTLGKLFIEA